MREDINEPEISIVIPAYNHGRYVEQAIKSVLDQTFQDWELIVIDDGSTDDTGEVIDAYSDHPRITICHQRNRGLSPTLNKGLEMARGRYFNFLPSDDFFHPDKLASQMEVIKTSGDLAAVFCDQIPVDSKGNPIKGDAISSWSEVEYVATEEILPRLFERNFIPAPSALINTEVLRSAGGFDESLTYTQDYDLWMRILPGNEVHWLHKKLLYYRWHGENLTFEADEPIHFERAYLLTKALKSLSLEDIYPYLRSVEEEEKALETARCYLRLAESLMRSGLIELLPWCRLFVNQARKVYPNISIPRILVEKLHRRKSFMDLRDSRLQDLAMELAKSEGELAQYKACAGELDQFYREMAELARYRQEIPDIVAERNRLHQEDKRLFEREQQLEKWNQSLDEKLEWLRNYEAGLELREQAIENFMNRLPVRIARKLYRSTAGIPRRGIFLAQKLWRRLPMGIRSRFGPAIKSRVTKALSSGQPDSKDLPVRSQEILPAQAEQVPSKERPSRTGFEYTRIFGSPPLVSVILPIYNHASSARFAIESILNQTYPNIELVIVNDGSTDGLEEVLAPYVEHPNIVILNQENQKLPKALTNGFRFAKGVFYTWTSADNIMLPGQIETLVDYLARRPEVDMTYSNVELIDENGAPLTESGYREHNQVPRGSNMLRLPSAVDTLDAVPDNFINASFLYRGEVGRALGPYDPRLLGTEDYDYWLRIKELFHISKLDSEQVLYQYRIHKNSLSERYGSSHIVHNVKKLIEDHGQRKKFYERKFCVLMLRKEPLSQEDTSSYLMARGFSQAACRFHIITTGNGEDVHETGFPHCSLDHLDGILSSSADYKYMLWVEDEGLLPPVLDGLKDKEWWCAVAGSIKGGRSQDSEADELPPLHRMVNWNRPWEVDDPILRERSIFLSRPLDPELVIKKAREDHFPIWQFPWRGGPVAIYTGPVDRVDIGVVEEVSSALHEWDFVFSFNTESDLKKVSSSLRRENVHFIKISSEVELYPLLSGITCVWAPVVHGTSDDLSHLYGMSLAAGKPFIVPENSVYRPDGPYCYGFKDAEDAMEQLLGTEKLHIDFGIADSYLSKYSPSSMARYVMAVANNDIFIEKECGGWGIFEAVLPHPMHTPAKRPKIVLEINSMDKGGMEEVVYNLAAQFDKMRFQVEVACADQGGFMAEKVEKAGVPISIFGKDVEKYRAYFEQGDVALLNTHYSDFGLGLARELKIPVVSTIHNAYVWFEESERKRFKEQDRFISHYIAVSTNVANYLTERLDVSPDKVTVVPNGVDTVRLGLLSQIEPKITRSDFGLSADEFIFLNVASLDGRKNHHAIVSAVERLVSRFPNIRVICAGNVMEPVYYEGVRSRVESLGLEKHILFPGFIKEVADLYRLADAFLLPSIVEGWSIAMTEALFFGLPLILTDVGGAADVLTEPWTGILVSNSFGKVTDLTGEVLGRYTTEENPSNLDELVAAMDDMITRHDYWKEYADRRRKLATEKYSIEEAVRNTVRVFEKFL